MISSSRTVFMNENSGRIRELSWYLIIVYRSLRWAHIVAANNRRKVTNVKIAKLWRQATAKREARFADGWKRPLTVTRRQGTNGYDRERSLANKIGGCLAGCLGGEWRCLDGARQQGTRSDGWQRIGWRQGTAADGGLRWQWRDWMADIKACVCVWVV